VTVPGSAEEMFQRRVQALPDECRRLLLLAVAEPAGDPALLWRAAGNAGSADETFTLIRAGKREQVTEIEPA
jgi:hypothetical protein